MYTFGLGFHNMYTFGFGRIQFQHVELDRKHWWTSGFWKRSSKQVALWKGYTAVLGFQLDLRNHQGLYFFFRVLRMVGLYFFSKTVTGFIGIVGFPQYVHFWVGFPQYVHFWVWKNPITTSRMMFQRVNFRLTLLMPQGQNEWLFQYTTSLSSRPAVKLRGQWRKYSVYTSTWNFLAGHAHSCSQNQLQSYVIDGTVSMTCFQIYLLIKNFVTTVYYQVSVSLLAANICLSFGPETRTHTTYTACKQHFCIFLCVWFLHSSFCLCRVVLLPSVCAMASDVSKSGALKQSWRASAFASLQEFLAKFAPEIVQLQKKDLRSVANSSQSKKHAEWKQ